MVTWYVAFTHEIAVKRIIMRFLKPRFRHCYVFKYVAPHCVVINQTSFNMGVRIYLNMKPEEVADILSKYYGAVIVKYVDEFKNMSRGFCISNFLPTCVTITKMAIGVRSIAITPYQLYNFLIGNGGEELQVTRGR